MILIPILYHQQPPQKVTGQSADAENAFTWKTKELPSHPIITTRHAWQTTLHHVTSFSCCRFSFLLLNKQAESNWEVLAFSACAAVKLLPSSTCRSLIQESNLYSVLPTLSKLFGKLLYQRDIPGVGNLPEMSTDKTGSDWFRTEANFGWIRTGSDWRNSCCFDVIIRNISKMLVAIRFYRFAKSWQCRIYFSINGKSSAETILQLELYPPLPTYNVEFW